ncbi:MAG TPA: hypothetical protein VMU40_10525 [Steroidobacteraceae bacterium]|nr:hypothetical protein [Steroidobacteraceae bacterium]
MMLTIIADYHDDPFELVGRRDRFMAPEFSSMIASDERSGSVLLIPERRTLTVSSSARDYERIRIFNQKGNLLGTMTCSTRGVVSWVEPRRA